MQILDTRNAIYSEIRVVIRHIAASAKVARLIAAMLIAGARNPQPFNPGE